MTSRADVAEAIVGVCDRAKRIPHVVGSVELPTEWDRRHQQIDLLLWQWQGLS